MDGTGCCAVGKLLSTSWLIPDATMITVVSPILQLCVSIGTLGNRGRGVNIGPNLDDVEKGWASAG